MNKLTPASVITSAGSSLIDLPDVNHELRPMSMRGEGFVEGEPGNKGRAITQFADFNVSNPLDFFEILRRKDTAFKDTAMAKEILFRVFDHGLLQDPSKKKRILSKDEIKEFEKAQKNIIL